MAPVPAGEVRVHWLQPPEGKLEGAAEVAYSGPFQEAVEASMAAVLAALQQEAKEKGFGKHVLVSAAAWVPVGCAEMRTWECCMARCGSTPAVLLAARALPLLGGICRRAGAHMVHPTPFQTARRSTDSTSSSRPTRSSLARPIQAML